MNTKTQMSCTYRCLVVGPLWGCIYFSWVLKCFASGVFLQPITLSRTTPNSLEINIKLQEKHFFYICHIVVTISIEDYVKSWCSSVISTVTVSEYQNKIFKHSIIQTLQCQTICITTAFDVVFKKMLNQDFRHFWIAPLNILEKQTKEYASQSLDFYYSTDISSQNLFAPDLIQTRNTNQNRNSVHSSEQITHFLFTLTALALTTMTAYLTDSEKILWWIGTRPWWNWNDKGNVLHEQCTILIGVWNGDFVKSDLKIPS